jgi:hypothetical protein
MQRMKRALGVVVVFLAVGCGSGSDHEVADTASPTTTHPSTTVTKPPRPKVWTVKQAGRKYLAMVGPLNRWSIKRADPVWKNPAATVSDLRRICRQTVPRYDRFMRRLSHGKWPKIVQLPIRNLIANIAKARAAEQQCVHATAMAEINSIQWPPNDAAQVVRVTLHLPGTRT